MRPVAPRWPRSLAGLACGILVFFLTPSARGGVPLFESPHVHPLELTPDGTRLLAVNTDDHRLVVFDVTEDPPRRLAEIPVGLEPVTVRARSNREAWVVNHLSDSVSRVDLDALVVVGTLLVGDEPTDVAFAQGKAFVSVSQEDRVRVFDLADLSTPPRVLDLPGSDPRSLVVSNDGAHLHVTFLDGGNRTTVVPPDRVQALGPPGVIPSMATNLPAPPATSLIVQWINGTWTGPLGGNWDAAVSYTMPDVDLVTLDTSTETVTRVWSDAGTSLFNAAIDGAGRLWVGNQEAHNRIRFEPNLRGRFVTTRVTRITPASGLVEPIPLNPAPGTPGVDPASAASFPLDVTTTPDGEVLIAAFGSAAVLVLNGDGTRTERIAVGHGPSGLAWDEANRRLFVLERFDHTIRCIDRASGAQSVVPLGYSPLSERVRDGRRLFYETGDLSSDGTLSCASCHLFGGTDGLGWDLGDPRGTLFDVDSGDPNGGPMHPMKGPMVTQTLKGLDGAEPFHWRGDRPVLDDFRGAFLSLLGSPREPTPDQFALLVDFLLALQPSPNPYRGLANELLDPGDGRNPTLGRRLFNGHSPTLGLACTDCHRDPDGGANLLVAGPGIGFEQDFAVPAMRSLYEKVRFTPDRNETVRGFGFAHDGRFGSLGDFFDHRSFTFDRPRDRGDLEAYLLGFGADPHAGMGAQWTFDGSNPETGAQRLAVLMEEAGAGRLGLAAHERLPANGGSRGWMYREPEGWIADLSGVPPREDSRWLLEAGPGSEVTVTATLPGMENRLGIDHDLDGYPDGDERAAGSDPHDARSTPATVPPSEPPAPVLGAAFPNPARTATEWILSGDAGDAALTVLDIRGRRVISWSARTDPGGALRIRWDLRDARGARVPAGVYFIRISVGSTDFARRVSVLPPG